MDSDNYEDDFVKLHDFDEQLAIIANTALSLEEKFTQVALLLAKYRGVIGG